MPSILVYLLSPRSIALMAARLMLSGVSKSGSPAPSPMTLRPAALSARALSVTAMVADGLMRLSESARKAMGISDRGNSCPWVLKHFRQKWNQLSLQNRDNPEKTGAANAGGAPSGDRPGYRNGAFLRIAPRRQQSAKASGRNANFIICRCCDGGVARASPMLRL